MRFSGTVLLSAVLGLCVACSAPQRLDPRSARFPTLTFDAPQPREFAMERGVPLYLLEDRDLPLVRIYLKFLGGALHDPPEKAGLASVLGPAWRTGGTEGYSPEAFDEALENRAVTLSVSLGRRTGEIALSVLSRDLEYALDLLEEMLLRPSFLPERVEWAVQQVREGIRRERDDPVSLAYREFRRALYAGHPRGVVATEETAARVEREDLLRFYDRLLTGGRWVVGAVGDFDSEVLRGELARRFGRLPPAGEAFEPIPPPVPGPSRSILVPKEIPQATVVWGRLGPARTDPDFYALDLADYVVGSGGFQSRLTREIRSNRGLAYSVGSFYQALPDFGVLGTQARTGTGSVGEVLDLTRSILDRVARNGVTSEELERARDAAVNRHVFRYQDLAGVVRERMALHLADLPEDLYLRYPERIAGVGGADVAAAAARWYADRGGVTVGVGALPPEALSRPDGPPVEVVGDF